MARPGHGPLQRSGNQRPLRAVARRGVRGGRPAGRQPRKKRQPREGWRIGNPTWVGPSTGIRYRITGRVTDLRAAFVRSPELKILCGRCRWRGRRRSFLAAGGAPTSRFAGTRRRSQPGSVSRSCTTLPGQRVLAFPGGRDHARDRDLPRQIERMERHRLQLPRRPVRHGVRGPVRRDRAECRRCARARIQHGLCRSRADRHVRERAAAGRCGDRAREAARLAPRSRTRRSARNPDRRVGRERAVSGRHSGLPALGLRAPRYRVDRRALGISSTPGSAQLRARPGRSACRRSSIRRSRVGSGLRFGSRPVSPAPCRGR